MAEEAAAVAGPAAPQHPLITYLQEMSKSVGDAPVTCQNKAWDGLVAMKELKWLKDLADTVTKLKEDEEKAEKLRLEELAKMSSRMVSK